VELSPHALTDLGITTRDCVLVALAPADAALGPVR
jgi:uncharacterized protein YjiS (DUF1127 family)